MPTTRSSATRSPTEQSRPERPGLPAGELPGCSSHRPPSAASSLGRLGSRNPGRRALVLPYRRDAPHRRQLHRTCPDEPLLPASSRTCFTRESPGAAAATTTAPHDSVTRAQMAVFLLKAEHGAAYGRRLHRRLRRRARAESFADWIEQLAAEGITGGCGGGNYCPDNPVTARRWRCSC